jgi:hypothetical protein
MGELTLHIGVILTPRFVPGYSLPRPSLDAHPPFGRRSYPFNVPPSPYIKSKNRLSAVLTFWRWGELNPRPEVRYRGVYRFIGARWLSGSGGSAASIGSVSWLMSRPPFRPSVQQAPVGVGRSGCFGAASSGFRVLYCLRSESVTVSVIGSYKFCPIRGRATSPAAQASTTTVETGAPPRF